MQKATAREIASLIMMADGTAYGDTARKMLKESNELEAENALLRADIRYTTQTLGAVTDRDHEPGNVYILDLCKLADETKETIESLRTALHDAINRPLGVVPDSALEFYEAEGSD